MANKLLIIAINIVPLKDFDNFSAINVGNTKSAETNKIPTALILTATARATKSVKTKLTSV